MIDEMTCLDEMACPHCKGKDVFVHRRNSSHVPLYYAQCWDCGIRTRDYTSAEVASEVWLRGSAEAAND